MAVRSKTGTARIEHVSAKPKRSRQGRSHNTHLGATSRNARRKRYRGQG